MSWQPNEASRRALSLEIEADRNCTIDATYYTAACLIVSAITDAEAFWVEETETMLWERRDEKMKARL